MLPEQVWDADPIPSRRLEPGRPTGSAMPLVWAHAEFIKLMVSHHLGRPGLIVRVQYGGAIRDVVRPFDMPSGGRMHRSKHLMPALGSRSHCRALRSCIGAVMAGTMPWTRQPVTAVSVSTSLHSMSATCRPDSASFSPGNGGTPAPGTTRTTRSRYWCPTTRERPRNVRGCRSEFSFTEHGSVGFPRIL